MKKILAVMLSAVLTVAMLVGCGDSVETGGRTKDSIIVDDEYSEIVAKDDDEGLLTSEEGKFTLLARTVTYYYISNENNENQGIMIIENTEYQDGDVLNYREYSYDALGNQIKEMMYNNKGNLTGWYEYTYDASGNIIRSVEYSSDGTIRLGSWREYEYDTSGNQIKELHYSSDGSYVNSWLEYEYSMSGNQIRETSYDNMGNNQGWWTYEYDNSNNLIQVNDWIKNGNLGSITVYENEYDGSGNLVRVLRYTEGTLNKYLTSYEYNEVGNLITEINYINGEETERKEYDVSGNLIRVIGGSKRTEYEYITTSSPENMHINSEVQLQVKESDTPNNYWNIALFGLDNFDETRLYKSSNSKNCIIISINTDTQEIKLVNINVDTYLSRGDTYGKVQGAYSEDGAEKAIKMLNMNLDMNLTDFISIGLPTCIQFIDGLGGIWVEVDDDIKDDINQGVEYRLDALYHLYGFDSSFITEEMKSDFLIETTGYQQLSGLQVAAWLVTGWRNSLKMNSAISEQMQNTDPAVLAQLFGGLRNDIYTSLSQEELDTFVDIFGNNGNYSIMDFVDFPRSDLSQSVMMGAKGSCVVPMDLEANVVWLHQFLFDQNDYKVSDTVREINVKVLEDASKYMSE